MLTVRKGNLLNSSAKYIAHQTNCLSTGSAGLAKSIFNRFPNTNVYKHRAENRNLNDNPGNIVITPKYDDTIEPDHESGYVIHMMAQYAPGKSNNECIHFTDRFTFMPEYESERARLYWFESCLEQIEAIPDLQSIAFPFEMTLKGEPD